MAHNFAEALRGAVPATEEQARLLTFLRDHRDQLPRMSYDAIARASGVSQPTVSRITRHLGYANAHEWRVAASLDMPGRLHPEQVRRGAELVRSGDDLHVFAPECLDRALDDLFKRAFPKGDVMLPMKPQLIRRRDVKTTPQRFNEGDVALILAVAALPEGYDFRAEFLNAQAQGVPVLLLQAVNFEVPGRPEGGEILSLGLAPSVHEAVASIYLAAAAAEIRTRAALA
jgi:DNA-directed RNA polymerase subunit H (RpoH/RPB5)